MKSTNSLIFKIFSLTVLAMIIASCSDTANSEEDTSSSSTTSSSSSGTTEVIIPSALSGTWDLSMLNGEIMSDGALTIDHESASLELQFGDCHYIANIVETDNDNGDQFMSIEITEVLESCADDASYALSEGSPLIFEWSIATTTLTLITVNSAQDEFVFSLNSGISSSSQSSSSSDAIFSMPEEMLGKWNNVLVANDTMFITADSIWRMIGANSSIYRRACTAANQSCTYSFEWNLDTLIMEGYNAIGSRITYKGYLNASSQLVWQGATAGSSTVTSTFAKITANSSSSSSGLSSSSVGASSSSMALSSCSMATSSSSVAPSSSSMIMSSSSSVVTSSSSVIISSSSVEMSSSSVAISSSSVEMSSSSVAMSSSSVAPSSSSVAAPTGNSITDPIALAIDTPFTSNVANAGRKYFTYNTTVGQLYRINLTNISGDPDLQLFSQPNYTTLIQNSENLNTTSESVIWTATQSMAYIRVDGYATSTFDIKIHQEASPVPPTSGDGSSSTPFIMNLDTPLSGAIAEDGNLYYAIQVQSGLRYQFHMTDLTEDVDMYLRQLPTTGTALKESKFVGIGPESFVWTATYTGVVYLRLIAYGNATYTLAVTQL